MGQKDTSPAAGASTEEVRPAAKTSTANKPQHPGGCAAGFYCYIGPNIAGLIQTGTVYRGTRSSALAAAAKAIEKYPLVKSLIVSGDELPGARLKVKQPGNALYQNYRRIAAERK